MRWLIAVFVSVLVFLLSLGGYFWYALQPARPNAESVVLRILPGSSLSQVTRELTQKKLIANPAAFKLYAKLRNWQNLIQSGYYRISPGSSTPAILYQLVSGQTEKISYTIPEGYRIDQASRKLKQYTLSPERYLTLSRKPDPQLIQRYPFLGAQHLRHGLEGFLFPDTYFLNGGEKELIEAQLARFQQVIMPLWQKRPSSHRLDLFQTLTLASIVELEGLLDRELPVIAGVFLKRLSIGMKLESDPTTEYALGWHQGAKGLSLKDIQIDSPYNTYRYQGLPPGPIGNPGLAAVKAVLYPEKTDYLYFVARGDGTHAFSKTYQEHLNAIRRIYAGKS
jgi:UPF0755 protein